MGLSNAEDAEENTQHHIVINDVAEQLANEERIREEEEFERRQEQVKTDFMQCFASPEDTCTRELLTWFQTHQNLEDEIFDLLKTELENQWWSSDAQHIQKMFIECLASPENVAEKICFFMQDVSVHSGIMSSFDLLFLDGDRSLLCNNVVRILQNLKQTERGHLDLMQAMQDVASSEYQQVQKKYKRCAEYRWHISEYIWDWYERKWTKADQEAMRQFQQDNKLFFCAEFWTEVIKAGICREIIDDGVSDTRDALKQNTHEVKIFIAERLLTLRRSGIDLSEEKKVLQYFCTSLEPEAQQILFYLLEIWRMNTSTLQHMQDFCQAHSYKMSSTSGLEFSGVLQTVLTDEHFALNDRVKTVVALILQKTSEQMLYKIDIENLIVCRSPYTLLMHMCDVRGEPGSNVMCTYASMTKAAVETKIGTAFANLLHNTWAYAILHVINAHYAMFLLERKWSDDGGPDGEHKSKKRTWSDDEAPDAEHKSKKREK